MPVIDTGQTNCPRCLQAYQSEALEGGIRVCSSCGHVASPYQKQHENRMKKRFAVTALVLALTLTGAFVLTLEWGHHAVRVIPLQTLHFLGLASEQQLSQLAAICKEQGKANCVEQTLGDISDSPESDLQFLFQYGKILSFNKKDTQAKKVFAKYFAEGGKSLDAAYEYAKVLSRTGDTNEAKRYFKMVLDAKPDIMQITIARAYVDHLLKNNELTEARQFILSWRRKGSNTAYFLEDRFRQINERQAGR